MSSLLTSDRPSSCLTGIGIFCGKIFCLLQPKVVVGELFTLPGKRYELNMLDVPNSCSFILVLSESDQLRLDDSVEIFNPLSESVGTVSSMGNTTTDMSLNFSSAPAGLYSFYI